MVCILIQSFTREPHSVLKNISLLFPEQLILLVYNSGATCGNVQSNLTLSRQKYRVYETASLTVLSSYGYCKV